MLGWVWCTYNFAVKLAGVLLGSNERIGLELDVQGAAVRVMRHCCRVAWGGADGFVV